MQEPFQTPYNKLFLCPPPQPINHILLNLSRYKRFTSPITSNHPQSITTSVVSQTIVFSFFSCTLLFVTDFVHDRTQGRGNPNTRNNAKRNSPSYNSNRFKATNDDKRRLSHTYSLKGAAANSSSN